MKRRFKFKSREPFYTRERLDIKNNTTRVINLNEEKFLDLIALMMVGFNDGDIEIEIIEARNDKVNNYFVRDVRDISVYNNLMILTWNPKTQIKQGEK